ncbi:ScbR family autoregulator-binding transcription factor [Streptomyces sp. NPDC047315]|uniref:ScbR family autoregulator-binding transcription factor n=1 Tax=Streptomyces sp. NPDC047315 TaxID=3155142 RepID=UPI0033C61D9D
MKQERAVRTRQSLIRAAAEAFERHGYVQAKLSEISASAGVTPGALHFHFPTKAAVASTVEATAATALRRAATEAQEPGMNALQRLTSITYALGRRMREDVVARAGYQLNCRSPHGAGLDLCQEWQSCVERLVAEAAEEGLLADGVTEEDMVATVVGATTGFESLARTEPDWLSPATLTRFWRLIMPRLAASEAAHCANAGPAPSRLT